jgi:hypothetical protein
MKVTIPLCFTDRDGVWLIAFLLRHEEEETMQFRLLDASEGEPTSDLVPRISRVKSTTCSMESRFSFIHVDPSWL